jgi:uncharacterized RDD family membrane protein YckC
MQNAQEVLVSDILTDFSPQPAEVPIRIAARLIDAMVLGTVAAVLGKLIGFGFDWLSASTVIVILYFVLMDVSCGATLGKLALGLRVIGPTGSRPTVRESFTREAFTVVGAVPYVGPFLALGAWAWIIVTIRSSALRQGKHDALAGTLVVRRNGRELPQSGM